MASGFSPMPPPAGGATLGVTVDGRQIGQPDARKKSGRRRERL
jgi:hypothetical protein